MDSDLHYMQEDINRDNARIFAQIYSLYSQYENMQINENEVSIIFNSPADARYFVALLDSYKRIK